MSGDDFTPDDGLIRLFPLPNVVLFPGAMLPLHIFEARYRQMTTDALAGDRLITMALPRPGWESDYAGSPAIHQVACVGRIMAEQQLPDGRFNILLRGLMRVHITEEVTRPKRYRTARVDAIDELPCTDAAVDTEWRDWLRTQAPELFQDHTELRERFLKLVDEGLALGALADVVAFTVPFDAEFKQKLLEERDVKRRLEHLAQQLSAQRRPFPPDFSAN
jgi:Lon protease-like protein